METYSPEWAKHIIGEYEPRRYDAEEKKFEPQRVRMHCTCCGVRHQALCETGAVRGHIISFAVLHKSCPESSPR